MLTLTITSNDHCRRLESFLRALLPASALAYPRKLIKSGAVKLNAELANPDTFLAVNDYVTIKESATLTAMLSDSTPTLDILYEDDQIIAVNKPSGLAMHRTAELESDLVELSSTWSMLAVLTMTAISSRGTPSKAPKKQRTARHTASRWVSSMWSMSDALALTVTFVRRTESRAPRWLRTARSTVDR